MNINVDMVYEQIPATDGISVNGIIQTFIDKKEAVKGDHTLYPSICAKIRSLRKQRLICVSHVIGMELYYIRR